MHLNRRIEFPMFPLFNILRLHFFSFNGQPIVDLLRVGIPDPLRHYYIITIPWVQELIMNLTSYRGKREANRLLGAFSDYRHSASPLDPRANGTLSY